MLAVSKKLNVAGIGPRVKDARTTAFLATILTGSVFEKQSRVAHHKADQLVDAALTIYSGSVPTSARNSGSTRIFYANYTHISKAH